MMTNRQKLIFKAIVDEFVATAEPVGSKLLMTKYQLPYSSATIRNDMQALEEMGYLEKTHTSSGRVPSTLGYRYYCENLMQNTRDESMDLMIRDIFANRRFNLEEAIQESCDILSQMTNLTSGVLGPDARNQRLEHIRLFPINTRTAVCVMITDTGHTENKTFVFDEDISIEDLQNTCDILNSRLKGTLIQEVGDKLESIKPILAANVTRYEMLFKAFVQAFMRFTSENVYFSGRGNMLYQPEFNDIEKLRSIMGLLQGSTVFKQIGDGTSHMSYVTREGSELTWFDDVAIVKSRFKVGDSEEGQLMVVGPSRMNYDRIVSTLESVSSMLENLYGGKNGKR